MKPWILLTLGVMGCLTIIAIASIVTSTQTITKTGFAQNNIAQQNAVQNNLPTANAQDTPPHAMGCGMGTGGGCRCGG